jgi:Ca-activated chloride channel family protein
MFVCSSVVGMKKNEVRTTHPHCSSVKTCKDSLLPIIQTVKENIMKKTISCLIALSCLVAAGCSDQSVSDHDKLQSQNEEISVPATVEKAVPPAMLSKDEQNAPVFPHGMTSYTLTDASGGPVLRHKMAAEAQFSGAAVTGMIMPAPTPLVAEFNRESYNPVNETGYINCANDPLSTFSIDVDTASYANVRRLVMSGQQVPAGAVRVEEMINYFPYDYPQPAGGAPLQIFADVVQSPYHVDYRLVRIGLQAEKIQAAALPPANLVFLIDVSGSMQQPNKLPLVKESLLMLVKQLTGRDRVSIVVYAGAERVVLQPTPGDQHSAIMAAIDNLQAGGSTHASQGILTAYQLARQAFMPSGNNRVILVSDGDFNVGVTSRSELQRLIEEKRKENIYLTVLGFGTGNFRDDTMELLADKGNGNYAYIDSLLEAKKVLVKEMSGTLFTLADDVKLQVEFNPALVGAYRLIGYENRALADEDFRDDRKDAGEIGAGHQVTALYEIIPSGHKDVPQVDALKYQKPVAHVESGKQELLTVKLRYKPRGRDSFQELSVTAEDSTRKLLAADGDFRFAAAVAGYAMLLQHSEKVGSFSWQNCMDLAKSGKGEDDEGLRAEFIRLVEMSEILASKG